jgi:DNA-binding response OmpR family regulator
MCIPRISEKPYMRYNPRMMSQRSPDPSDPHTTTAMSSAAHILLVDDDALMRRSLDFTLKQAGYRTSAAASAEDALALAASDMPDLVLLDIGLPGMDGLDAIKAIHQHYDLPVIFVTARRRELEQVLGLELGADDYITKPFDSDILLARIKAVLRRSRRAPVEPAAAPAEYLAVGDMAIDLPAHRVQVGARRLELSPREFALLLAFARAPERVLSVDELLASVWGDGYAGEPQIVYVHVRRLREKLEDDPTTPRRIVTVRGIGYKLVAHDGDSQVKHA